MPFNTHNPLGSVDDRDVQDNAENLDLAVNSLSQTFVDRFGTVRKTRHGMEAEHDAQISAHEAEHDNQMQSFESDFDGRLAGMAFTRVGSFTAGATLTDMRQVLVWEVSQGGDGHEYGWSGVFPKVVAAGATPETSGGIGAGAWVFRSDASLRSELLSQGGASLIGTTTGDTVEQLLLSYHDITLANKADTAGSSTQTFSVADATTDTQAASYGQVKSRTSSLYVTVSLADMAMTLTLPRQTLKFRNPTLTNGAVIEYTLLSDLTLTIPQGATVGTISNVLASLVPIVLYNGGNPVLGVSNLAGGFDLSEAGLLSSTAISASAKSRSVVYASSAVTNSPYITAGLLQSIQATAGTWVTAPSVIPKSTNLAAMIGGVGYSAPIDVSASRSFGTAYYNTLSKPKKVKVGVSVVTATESMLTLTVSGIVVDTAGFGVTSNAVIRYHNVEWIVLPGASYLVSCTAGSSIVAWIEA